MKTIDSDTMAGMIVFLLFIAWCVSLFWPCRNKKIPNKPDEEPEEPDEFDPSQIF
jgi:hypothetical protein